MIATWTFRIEKTFDWAVAFVTEDGFFSVVSDYGNYGYYWSEPGTHILKFLGERGNPDYFLSKLSPVQEVNFDATCRAIRDSILQMRRTQGIDSDTAEMFWTDIEAVEHSDMGLEEFDRENGGAFPDYRLPRVMKHDVQAQQFMKIIWPQLQQLFLKKYYELAGTVFPL